MTSASTKPDFSQPAIKTSCALFDDGGFGSIELSVRGQVRVFIEEMIKTSLMRRRLARVTGNAALSADGRCQACRRPSPAAVSVH
jgi:hypothetical protein